MPVRLVLAAVLALTAAIYAPLWDAPFVYEDYVYVDRAQTPTDRLVPVAPRAITEWTFRANALADGTDPRGYHAVNVVLHLATGLLLFATTRRIFATEGYRADAIALLTAAVFLLHPIQTQAVSYVAGRADLIAGFGVVLALFLAAGGRVTLARGAGIAAALGLACGGKEMGLTGVLLLAGFWAWKRPCWGPSKASLRVALAVLICVVGPLVYERLLASNEYAFASERNGLGYMAVQSAALLRMLSLVVWPSGLSIDHDWAMVSKAAAFTSLAIVALGCVAAWAVRRRAPMVAIAGLWIAGAMLPRFFIRIPEFLTEHQFYLSMIGVSLLVGQLVLVVPTVARVLKWSAIGVATAAFLLLLHAAGLADRGLL